MFCPCPEGLKKFLYSEIFYGFKAGKTEVNDEQIVGFFFHPDYTVGCGV